MWWIAMALAGGEPDAEMVRDAVGHCFECPEVQRLLRALPSWKPVGSRTIEGPNITLSLSYGDDGTRYVTQISLTPGWPYGFGTRKWPKNSDYDEVVGDLRIRAAPGLLHHSRPPKPVAPVSPLPDEDWTVDAVLELVDGRTDCSARDLRAFWGQANVDGGGAGRRETEYRRGSTPLTVRCDDGVITGLTVPHGAVEHPNWPLELDPAQWAAATGATASDGPFTYPWKDRIIRVEPGQSLSVEWSPGAQGALPTFDRTRVVETVAVEPEPAPKPEWEVQRAAVFEERLREEREQHWGREAEPWYATVRVTEPEHEVTTVLLVPDQTLELGFEWAPGDLRRAEVVFVSNRGDEVHKDCELSAETTRCVQSITNHHDDPRTQWELWVDWTPAQGRTPPPVRGYTLKTDDGHPVAPPAVTVAPEPEPDVPTWYAPPPAIKTLRGVEVVARMLEQAMTREQLYPVQHGTITLNPEFPSLSSIWLLGGPERRLVVVSPSAASVRLTTTKQGTIGCARREVERDVQFCITELIRAERSTAVSIHGNEVVNVIVFSIPGVAFDWEL